jgi:hypothetical protein
MDVCVPSMKLTLDMEPHRQQRLKEIDYTIKLIHQVRFFSFSSYFLVSFHCFHFCHFVVVVVVVFF